MMQKTIVYIDGFNFYYGQLKGQPYKWLDLHALFSKVLGTQHDVIKIKYFTARVQPTLRDPDVHLRQDIYLKALQAFSPLIEVHFGHFLRHKVKMENANPPPPQVAVWKTEEKGSDVNMALHVLNDAWKNSYDCAVIVSNDSDLAESLRMIKTQLGKKVGLITPGSPKRKTSFELKKHADFIRTMRESALRSSLLPNPIPGTNLNKPASW